METPTLVDLKDGRRLRFGQQGQKGWRDSPLSSWSARRGPALQAVGGVSGGKGVADGYVLSAWLRPVYGRSRAENSRRSFGHGGGP
jgi:hypothetical protein